MMKKMHLWLLPVLTVTCLSASWLSWRSYRTVKMLAKETRAVHDALSFDVQKDSAEVKVWDTTLCKSLGGLPYAEDLGIVKAVKRLELDGVVAPHNASIVEVEDGYLMFFRFDQKERMKIAGMETPFRRKIPFTSKKMPYRTFIGAVRLSKDFSQVSSVHKIDTGSDFSEDPRAFFCGGKLYVSYNDMQDNPVYSRTMHLVEVDPKTFKTQFVLDIDQHIQHIDQPNHIEKNWVPFVSQDAQGEETIHFEYSINPHKILRMKNPASPEMEHLVCPHPFSLQRMPWKTKWGVLRGGTPARLVNGEYLAFFHTLFYEGKRPWYVMGAYTFEAKPPHRVTAITPHPLLFKGIYDTKAKNTAHSSKRAIYPAGMALGREEGRDVIYLSCGENDCAVKLLTLDQEALLRHLVPVPLYQPKAREESSP